VSTHQNCSSNTEDESGAIWVVYFAICSDGSIYTGITTDLARREYEHNHTSKGAKYTRSRRPVKLHGIFACESRSPAMKIEINLKRMRKKNKLKLLFDRKLSV
jgi:putative endonuclease